ncbi:hypothetical protein QMA61_00920 [Streptomyces coelicoflavus]|uniref:hypothetical protein n=1 Tax=Streptomyces coelicoflavus TaxID=285562 RepID=UPI0024ADA9B5|nr:hypothetical protein [Streptomyces coelicoflavus]MDI6514753.1 hypothetical protein [Streptomyces coelicoflavus]
MNLAWIVALLRPMDLLSGRSVEESDPTCQLAALVAGEPLYRHKFEVDLATDELGIKSVAQSLDSSVIREGLVGLVRHVVEQPDGDIAHACALGLMACCAAAEIEDYAACELVLESLLSRIEANGRSDLSLLRALVLQQKSLRLWDTGQNFQAVSTEALRLIGQVTVKNLPTCKLGPYADFDATMSHLIAALRRAIWSLAPTVGISQVSAWSGFPAREQVLKSPRSEQLVKVSADRAEVYAKFVQQTFRNRFGGRTRYIVGGPEVPDTFAQELALELVGHAGVRESRKELALLRLIQIDAYEQSEHLRDALRLLRHSGAYKELSLAVERFRMAGPLWALSEDARQIIERRTGPYAIGRNELRVLRAAAELMTTTEANRALRAVQDWNNESYAGESWQTAVFLSKSAGKDSEVSEVILRQVEGRDGRADRLDAELARTVRSMDWSKVRPAVKAQWSHWWRNGSDSWPATAESLLGVLEIEPDDSVPLRDLDAVAVRINGAIRGASMPPSIVQQAVELVAPELHALIREAQGNSYSMKVLSAADIAAGLISYCGADLWDDLTACLVDPRISRSETDAAFERLSRERPPITGSASKLIRRSARRILEKRDRFFDSSSEVTPYPEALRFLAAYSLIDDDVLFASVAELAGNSSAAVREQAARTVATIAEVRQDTWILALAIQLSHDHDVAVRSHAGHALAPLADNDELAPNLIQDRIVQLLGEDGIATPLRLLDAMKNQRPIAADVRNKVEQLLSDHPSRNVRRAAEAVIARYV